MSAQLTSANGRTSECRRAPDLGKALDMSGVGCAKTRGHQGLQPLAQHLHGHPAKHFFG
jgi:hypothetical protein